MARIDIADLDFTRAVEKLWNHGLTVTQARSVLGQSWVVTRNRRGRAAPYLLIGRDEQGRCLTMPIVPTDDPLTWRVITGWNCKPSEAAILRRRRAIMEQPIRFEPSREPFDADEIEHMDPDNWDWDDPLEGVTVGDPRAILRIPFSFDEVDALFQVARARGLTTEELVRQLAVDALHAARA
ncbi:MAG: hypothetical protein K0S78_2789 [Thermomicrobiales bacterium]|nr:hypothetical protein [Thermomicrobiales bacterium]MDF3039948.1 hypothetical protein [Thermomicrobiales bacterium]